MRLRNSKFSFVFAALCLYSLIAANDPSSPPIPDAGLKPEQQIIMAQTEQKFEFQSDIARLMRVVVSHLYHDSDVFLRELVSNSGDALEKLRVSSLTYPQVLDSAPALNISIIADKPGKRLIIRDSGIGMTREELQKNLGTIARSGTSEFLSKIEKADPDKKSGTGANLIGQFGLGFYSSFLVADRVLVASKSNDDPKQWVFESDANAAEFKISEDPRGPCLGRGTEITLFIKDDAADFLEVDKLKELISTHSAYAISSPIFLWTEKEEDVPIDELKTETLDDKEKGSEGETKDGESEEANSDEKSGELEATEESDKDADEKADGESEEHAEDMKIDSEDEKDGDAVDKEEDKTPKTKKIKVASWEQLNTKGPIWTRDPKEVTDAEHSTFYKSFSGAAQDPVSWIHWKGDAGRTSFVGLIYIPDSVPNEFYSKTYIQLDSVRLYVRKVLITKEPTPTFLPKWMNWLKVIIDADDLPLNVGRDSLQADRSLKQIQNIIVKKYIDHLVNMSKKDTEKYNKLWEKIGTSVKVGVVDDSKNRDKMAKLLKFHSSNDKYLKDQVSLDDYVSRRKQGQKQIYFIAGAGMEVKDLSKSPFVEKLVARGYEVLYLVDPMDEMLTSTLGTFDGLRFQDVAKKGLKMGDEDEADEKSQLQNFKKEYEPLSKWIQEELKESVSEVVISNRLTTSPCAVVTDSYAWTGNMERLMAAQGSKGGENNFMMDMFRKAKKVFEINPKHPLIKGLLIKVADAEDPRTKEELKETVSVLWDTTLIRSGFNVPNTNQYFERIEMLLRKSIGVSESEKLEVGEIKPAPPVEVGPVNPGASDETNSEAGNADFDGSSFPEWSDIKDKIKEDDTIDIDVSKLAGQSSDKEPEIDEEETVANKAEKNDPLAAFGDHPEALKLKEEMLKDFGGAHDEL